MRYSDLSSAIEKSAAQAAIADLESPFDPPTTKADVIAEGLRVAGAFALISATKRALSDRPGIPSRYKALATAASFVAADYILATGGLGSNVQETRRTPQPSQIQAPTQAQALSARQV